MKHLSEKLLHRYVRYWTMHDESRGGKVVQILAQNNLLTSLLLNIAVIISAVWDLLIQKQYSLGTLLLAFVQQFNNLYALRKMGRQEVAGTEFENRSEFKEAVRSVRLRAFLEGWFLGISLFVDCSFVFPFLFGEPIKTFSVWLWLLIGGVVTLLYSGAMYFVLISDVKYVGKE